MLLAIDLDINKRRENAIRNNNYCGYGTDTVEWNDKDMVGAVCGCHEVVWIKDFGTCMRSYGLTTDILPAEDGPDYLDYMRMGVYSDLKENVDTYEVLGLKWE